MMNGTDESDKNTRRDHHGALIPGDAVCTDGLHQSDQGGDPVRTGTSESPASYAAGDVRTYAGQPWKCAQAHTHRGEPGWEPGTAASLWANYHAMDAAHALPWITPTGAHDAYQTGEWMIWTDGNTYRCTQNATVWGPDELPSAWEVGT